MPYLHAVHCEHDPMLVVLSYVIAVLGSLTALQTALAMPNTPGPARVRAMLWAGAAMGFGAIWSMHFIAMLGCRMDIPVSYDLGITALSALIAWASCCAGFAVAGGERYGRYRLWPAGLLTGLGVSGMHYTGMAAMQMPATIQWNPLLVALSVAIAISAALIALWLAFHPRGGVQMVGSALVMGVAVSGLHYTGMAAATFVPLTGEPPPSPMALTPARLGMLIFAVMAGALIAGLLAGIARERQLLR
ncbi:MAG TPA: MHYT domain-containing protein [Lysobacter sp.]|nr:MHYT domain-containing protein [Lysobacter sp.]